MVKEQIAGILFLDIRHYSKLNLDELETYHECVIPVLHNIVTNNNKSNYIYKNSWGDGIVLIDQDYYRLVAVGLELRDYFKDEKFERVVDKNGKERTELREKDLLPRIAVHFGEFKLCKDPFQNGDIGYGPTLFLPARIEPITPAGCVWVTGRIKEFVEDRQNQKPGGKVIKFIEQGDRKLAKNFKIEKLYEAYWANEPEPSVFKDESEIDIDGAKKEPEKYEDIDPETTKRIKAFTNEEFNGTKISVCSREPTNTKCPVKAKSMRVLFDISRNGHAAVEECQIAYWVKAIIESAKPLVPYFEGDKDDIGFSSHLQNLHRDIMQFFKCFEDFRKKQPQEWPDMKQWPNSFISWRVGHNKGTYINQCEAFVSWVEKVSSYYETIRKQGKAIKDITPRDVPVDVVDCIKDVNLYAEALSLHLNELGKDRHFVIDDILATNLKGFDRFAFAGHLQKVISQMADKFKSDNNIPSAWS